MVLSKQGRACPAVRRSEQRIVGMYRSGSAPTHLQEHGWEEQHHCQDVEGDEEVERPNRVLLQAQRRTGNGADSTAPHNNVYWFWLCSCTHFHE